jgi:nucleotide-binding universal stress UspA family protein
MSRFHTILVALDFSEHSDAALDRAIALAKTSGATLHLLHAYEVPLGSIPIYDIQVPQSMLDAVRDASARRMEKARARAEAAGVACQVHLTASPPTPAIVDTARALHADLIVMGTRGLSGFQHVLLGSNAERTVRLAPCPVLTLKPDTAAKAKFARILAPVDFSKQGEAALALAIELAREHGGEVHLLHAYDIPAGVAMGYGGAIPQSVWDGIEAGARASLDKLAEPLKSAGVRFKTHLSIGPGTDAILETAKAEKVDVIVMGTHGRRGFHHLLLGSVAERTLRLATCPVLTIRSQAE